MVLAAGVPAVYKRAAWSVYNSDKDARVVELRLRFTVCAGHHRRRLYLRCTSERLGQSITLTRTLA